MNNKNIIFFIAGLLTGAGGMYLGMKAQTEKYIQKEIDDYKNYIEIPKKEEAATEEEIYEEIADEVENAEDKVDYQEIIRKLDYHQFSTKTSKDEGPKEIEEKPYIITPEEFESDMNFDKKVLSYFSEDEVLIDSLTEEVIDDIGRTVGYENLEHFGVAEGSEINELYIRNEMDGVDYQIIFEIESYADYIEINGDNYE